MQTPTTPLLATARIEPLENRQYQATDPIGINVNDSSSTAYAVSKPVLKQLGVTSVRLWYGIDDWSDRKVEGGLQRAIDYSNDGYDVTMTIAIDDRKVPDPDAVRGWFKWAAGNDALAKAVDRWQVGNEVDSDHYFKGSLKQYVNNFLKPASRALHAEGERVVSGSVSWNPEDVKEMIGYGMLDYVDAVGFHPYANGVRLQKQRIAEINDVVDGRKPIVATEWNVRGFENNKSQWAASLNDAFGQVRDAFAVDYYFCLFVTDTPAGPAGLMTNKGKINHAFYDAFLRASRGVATNDPPPVDSTPAPVGNGNAPAGNETQIALYDAKTDRVISGYTNLKNNQVIDLADLPSDDLAIVTMPGGKATSVRMTLDEQNAVESTAPYAMFGDKGGDLFGRTLAAGLHHFSVTPYSMNQAKGTAYATRSIKFTVVDSRNGSTPPADSGGDKDTRAEIEGFALVDAKTGRAIKGYEHITRNTTVKLSSLTGRSVALLALADEDAASLRLSVNGVGHLENVQPYAFFSDQNGKLAAWKPKKQAYDFSAAAFDRRNGKGLKGDGLSITLRFV